MFPTARLARSHQKKNRSPCPHRMTGHYSDTGKSINLIIPQRRKIEQTIHTHYEHEMILGIVMRMPNKTS